MDISGSQQIDVGCSQELVAAPGGAQVLSVLDHALGLIDVDPTAAKASLFRLTEILRGAADIGRNASIRRGGLAPWQKRRIEEFVGKHLERTIAINDLAAIAALSPGHFGRAFKASWGETPHAYVTRRRLEKAQRMMLSTGEELCQIAIACGFADQAHLTRLFRKAYGRTPRAWQRLHTAT